MDELNERVADARTEVTRDLTDESGQMRDPGQMRGEASAKKPSSKKSGQPPEAGGSAAAGGSAGSAQAGSMADEVDQLLRSSEDGKM